MTVLDTATNASHELPTAFERVICGIDASRVDPVAVRQAAILAGGVGSLDIVCVTFSAGTGSAMQSTISRPRAERALRRADVTARKLGVAATTRLINDSDAWQALAREARDQDVLVVGTHSRSRKEGIMLGRTATQAVHRSDLPVLVARTEPAEPFPRDILIAIKGSRADDCAAELATKIAGAHGSRTVLLTVGPEREVEVRGFLAEIAADIRLASGVEPVVLTPRGDAQTEIVKAARTHESSLVIVGSGRRSGLRAIGSVSEHVAHHAPCSVLVARRPSESR